MSLPAKPLFKSHTYLAAKEKLFICTSNSYVLSCCFYQVKIVVEFLAIILSGIMVIGVKLNDIHSYP